MRIGERGEGESAHEVTSSQPPGRKSQKIAGGVARAPRGAPRSQSAWPGLRPGQRHAGHPPAALLPRCAQGCTPQKGVRFSYRLEYFLFNAQRPFHLEELVGRVESPLARMVKGAGSKPAARSFWPERSNSGKRGEGDNCMGVWKTWRMRIPCPLLLGWLLASACATTSPSAAATAAPASEEVPVDAADLGGPPVEDVARVVAQSHGAFKGCVDEELRKNPNFGSPA